jgi:uncharacterized repeat protein (TIGR03803 family)
MASPGQVSVSGFPNGINTSPTSPFILSPGSPQQITFFAPEAAGVFRYIYVANRPSHFAQGRLTSFGAMTATSFQLTVDEAEGTDGNFYSTTLYGGIDPSVACPANSFEAGGCGTVFKMTPAGVLTTLHKFNMEDGTQPSAALVQGNDGAFYGTTAFGVHAGLETSHHSPSSNPRQVFNIHTVSAKCLRHSIDTTALTFG